LWILDGGCIQNLFFLATRVLIFMTAIVRDALDREFNEIASLAVAAYQEYARALTVDNWEIMRSNLLKMTEEIDRGQLIVAAQDKELIGSVIYAPPGTSELQIFSPEWASVRRLAVSPAYRGQGIGAQLTLECIRRARQDRAKIIGLHTSELMVAARKMYEQLGFQQDIELPPRLGIKYWRYILKLAQ
jgi:ribosomal protein S18 acetylase RimI-like enzyme